jgi:hypothetical protein
LQTIASILAIAIALASPDLRSSREVTAVLLDGTSIAGELRTWNAEEVIIVRDEKETRVATGELVSIRWPRQAPSTAENELQGGFVELTDGTILPAKEIVVAKSTATVTIGSLLPDDKKVIRLPLPQLAAVCLQELEPTVEEQWDQIRSQELASDVLVVKNRDGKSLDYVEGVLGNVTQTKIEFEHEGDVMRVDRTKVAGWLYFRKSASAQTEPRAILHGRMGLRADAADARLSDQIVQITTAGGIKLEWPLSDLHFADFSSGKIVYLSDLEPVSQRWTPLVGLTAAAESAAKYGQIRLDQSAFGRLLTLRVEESGSSLGEVKSFGKGVAIRSRTELVYRLPRGFEQFVALAGIDPATSATGAVRLAIYADDRSVFDADIAGDQSPHEIELDIAGVKRLKIVVDFGRNLDTGDWLNLCEARLIK